MTDQEYRSKRLTKILLYIYLAMLCWIMVLKLGVDFSYMQERRVNLVPFADYIATHGKISKTEMVLNVLIFIPLGIYLAMLLRSIGTGRIFFRLFLISLVIEGLQWLLGKGAFDTTDIVNNTLGGIIGVLVVLVLDRLTGHPGKLRRWMNTMALAGTVLLVLLLVLLKLDMLPIRYR